MAIFEKMDLRVPAMALALGAAIAAGASYADSPAQPRGRDGRFYGQPLVMGNGTLRSYVVLEGGVATEIGVAISESALQGLPQAGAHGGSHESGSHTDMVEFLPPLPPEAAATPFKLIEVDWNPAGHVPPGVYDLPHFDFHFYGITKAERDRITQDDPEFGEKAVRYPAEQYLPAGYIAVDPVPRMGQHWIDPTSPELHGETFTRTLIYGTWDGELIFVEPMITKAFIESKPNITLPIPQPLAYAQEWPRAERYSIRYDAAAREYRIALEGLTAAQQ